VGCTLIERKEAPEFLPKIERCNARTMEIFRRLGIADRVRGAGLRADVPMDVFIVLSLAEPPLVHLPYPSVEEARAEIRACNDGRLPLEPYQLISQYTLEPLLKTIAESLPSVSVRYGCRLESFTHDEGGVTARVTYANGSSGPIHAAYLADGGSRTVRKQLGINLRGEYNILELRQALYRCDELFDRIPIGNGPGKGRHYHVADGKATFLIMQDSTRHFTLHSVVERNEDMNAMFERTVAVPVRYEMLACNPWQRDSKIHRNRTLVPPDAGVSLSGEDWITMAANLWRQPIGQGCA
jgi:2-polyprenyl-6-methoxyphenol hydroxylase-like FAD-dependent oxidoreductase